MSCRQSQVQTTTTMILASASPVLYLLSFGYDAVSGDMMLAGGMACTMCNSGRLSFLMLVQSGETTSTIPCEHRP